MCTHIMIIESIFVETVLSQSILTDFTLLSTGPPVNVTCNIFINSFGSIAETTMVCIPNPEMIHAFSCTNAPWQCLPNINLMYYISTVMNASTRCN